MNIYLKFALVVGIFIAKCHGETITGIYIFKKMKCF